jgi:hypothetical protein
MIGLPAPCLAALKRHRKSQKAERRAAGKDWKDHGLVFTTTIGTPIEPRNLNRHFVRLLDTAGLRRVRFHDLRHSCATLLYEQGVPIEKIQDVDGKFHKYDIIHVEALPARQDQRRESWKPIVDTITTERHLASRQSRRNLLDPLVEDSMCRLNKQARDDPGARSIALIRVADISSLQVKRHPGWSAEDRKKIAGYLNQLDLLEPAKRSPLQAPRFTGAYRYRCADRHCRGHQQTLWDWEFVALQRRLDQLTDAEAAEQLRNKFLTQLCAADRDVAFYVGNQAARPQSFSIGGVYAETARRSIPIARQPMMSASTSAWHASSTRHQHANCFPVSSRRARSTRAGCPTSHCR